LGLRVGIMGRVGDDDFGRLALRRLDECGVDTQHVIVDPTLKTGLGVALCRTCTPGGDRAILTYPGSLCALQAGDVTDAFLASARHLHHGSFFLQTGLRPHIPEILARAKALGVSTSLDPNWDPDEWWNSTLLDALPSVDIFFPNDQEALHISRRPDVQKAAAWLRAQGASVVAIKQGAGGASLYSAQASYECPVAPAVRGDSIGAGDSFDAGFLAAWLRGLPPEQCLAIACRCGRAVASAVGGLAGQLSWDRVKETLQP
jgi:sugar/nucleoside kinase (ribokinase family)